MEENLNLYKQLAQRIENQSLELYLLQTQISVLNRFLFKDDEERYLEYLQELVETLQTHGKTDPTYSNEYIDLHITEIQNSIAKLKSRD